MYRIDVLIKNNWFYLYENDDMYLLNNVIHKTLKKGYQIRITENEKVVAFLNSIMEYDYWLALEKSTTHRR